MPGGGGTQRLPRLIGIAAAAPLLLEGKRLKPADALAAGIIRCGGAAGQVARRGEGLGARQSECRSALGREGLQAARLCAAIRRRPACSSWEAGRGCTSAAQPAISQAKRSCRCCITGWSAASTPASRSRRAILRRLAASPDAKAKIRTLFVGTTDAKAMKMRPKDVAPSKPARVTVIGGGVMGRGIAYVAAQAGLQVDLIDMSDEVAAKSRRRHRTRAPSATASVAVCADRSPM